MSVTNNQLLIPFFVISVCFLAVATSIGTVIISPLVSFILITICLFSYYLYNKALLFFVIITVLFFKNILVAFYAPFIENSTQFKLLLGIDFYCCCIITSLIAITEKKIKLSVIVLVLCIMFFFLLGIINNGFLPAATYLRSFTFPFIIYYLALRLMNRSSGLLLVSMLKILVLFVATLVLLEILFTYFYVKIFSINEFFSLKSTLSSYSATELIETNTKKLFNYFDVIRLYRPYGFTLQPISTGYIVAGIAIYMLSIKKTWPSYVAMIILICLGSKGPLLIFVTAIGGYIFHLSASRHIILMTSLVSLIIIMGLNNQDPHVYSLISSIVNIPSNILGRGLGYGGAITTGTDYGTNFESINGDSGMAIVLNMMGVIGLLYYFMVYRFFYKIAASINIKSPRPSVIQLYIIGMFFTGLIQEEAITTYSMGTIALILAISLSTQHKIG